MGRPRLNLTDSEKLAIISALKKHNGSRKLAAKELDISIRALALRIKNIPREEVPEFDRSAAMARTWRSRGRRSAPTQPTASQPPLPSDQTSGGPGDPNPKSSVPAEFVASELVTTAQWEEYERTRSIEARNAIVVACLSIVSGMAMLKRRAGKLPFWMTTEEFISMGTEGLIEAVETFDRSKGYRFTTWAGPKIWFRAVDRMRELNICSRNMLSEARSLDDFRERFLQRHSRQPTADEACEALNWEPAKYQAVLNATASVKSLDRPMQSAFDHSTRDMSPYETLTSTAATPPHGVNRQLYVERILRGLPVEEKIIMYLYYFKSKTMKCIGQTLDLSESRVSQMHAAIIGRLRDRFDAVEEFDLIRA